MSTRFLLAVDTSDGGTQTVIGTADSASHAAALQLRDNWREWAKTPGKFFTLSTPMGARNVYCSDMTDVRVERSS